MWVMFDSYERVCYKHYYLYTTEEYYRRILCLFYIYLVGQKVSLISIHVLRKNILQKEEMHVEYKLDCPLYVLV